MNRLEPELSAQCAQNKTWDLNGQPYFSYSWLKTLVDIWFSHHHTMHQLWSTSDTEVSNNNLQTILQGDKSAVQMPDGVHELDLCKSHHTYII